MPLFHSNAVMAGWAPAVAARASIALRRKFSASQFLPDVRRFGATYANYVGKPLSYILATPEQPDDADNPLRVVYGNEGAPRDVDRFATRFGVEVVDGFGSTEGGVAIARTPDTPEGALGPLADGVAIVDVDTGEPCPPGVIGELVNTTGPGQFRGYYNDSDAEAERMAGGVYHSGDLAYRDEAGYAYFAGRLGDWMRVDGENLGTAPIERVLLRYPDVTEAAVYPIPDPAVGDRVMAALVLPDSRGLRAAVVHRFPRPTDRPRPQAVAVFRPGRRSAAAHRDLQDPQTTTVRRGHRLHRPGPRDQAIVTTRREDIATMLTDRLGDRHLGLRTREQDWTWDEVVRESAARANLATALRAELFADAPCHIGILLDNVADFVFWLGGASLAGATVVGLNPTRGSSGLAADIRHADCQLVVTDAAGRQRLADLDHGLPADRFLVVDDPAYRPRVEKFRADPAVAPGAGPDTLMLLLFTSGTTGVSKAVRCSQGRLARIAYAAADKYGHHRGDVDYCCMPLFHGNAIMALWAPALSVGATVCLTPSFSASRFLSDVRFFGATFFTYVGKAMAYVMATPALPDDSDNTLTRAFGTEASPDDQAEFVRRFGATLYEGYGSSEGGAVAAADPAAPPGALGRPAHADVAVVDPETLEPRAPAVLDPRGKVLNPDEAIGEIVDRRGARDFEGYYRNDAADADRVRNGWYWTGDLGYVDGEGFLYFAGRRGDWIRVDGENTSAVTIERVLRRHPGVIAAAAYGVPDPRSGDQVMAAVEVADPAAFDVVDLASFLIAADDLGSKGIPRLLRVSARLPATGSNKVLKRDLQVQRWHRSDDGPPDLVYRWVGRGRPDYRVMSDDDCRELDSEFASHGRQSHV